MRAVMPASSGSVWMITTGIPTRQTEKRSENIRISGILHTVNPIAVESVPVYHENTREYCLLKTERFGTLIQMEVGAMMVGRICNYHGPRYVKKGSEKGRFEFGGSTILLAGPERPGNFPGEISEKHGSGHRDPGGNGRMVGTAK